MRPLLPASRATYGWALALAAVSLGCSPPPQAPTTIADASVAPVAAVPVPAAAPVVAAAPYAGPLPAYAQKSESIAAMYRWAAPNRAILQYFQCTCGCDQEAGHTSNWNCYVKEEKPGGEYVWDPMSAG